MRPQEHLAWHHEDPPKDFFPVVKSLLYITLLIVVLICPAIQYPINIASILGIWTTDFLITQTDAELIGVHRYKRERDDSLCLRVFPKDKIIITHYMLSAW